MIEFIHDSWHGVMNHKRNPLRHIPDQNVRHLVLQLLAWMWCVAFSLWVGSMWVFGFTAIVHLILIFAIVMTVAVFEISKRRSTYFDHWYKERGLGRGNGGEHE